MNIVIFGGAGFIGRFVVSKLQALGHSIIVADNYSTGNMPAKTDEDISYITLDITKKQDFDALISNPDIIIHLAFPTSLCNRDPENQFLDVASHGMLNILEYTKKTCKKIIYGSSISVYGIPESLPIIESNKIAPILIYGCNKYMNELYIKTYAQEYGIRYNILRISDTFGPFDKRKNAINNFIMAFLNNSKIIIGGTGEQIRTFTYVEDIAEAIVISTQRCNNTEYTIASETNISINKLIEHLETIFSCCISKEYMKNTIDSRDYIFDCNKFKQEFGSFEKIGFNQGLDKTIQYLKISKI